MEFKKIAFEQNFEENLKPVSNKIVFGRNFEKFSEQNFQKFDFEQKFNCMQQNCENL